MNPSLTIPFITSSYVLLTDFYSANELFVVIYWTNCSLLSVLFSLSSVHYSLE
ncbi:MAG: hypothetical protein WCL00_16200 [Bacteroidota bacterium]